MKHVGKKEKEKREKKKSKNRIKTFISAAIVFLFSLLFFFIKIGKKIKIALKYDSVS
jgi:cell division protein FtsB